MQRDQTRSLKRRVLKMLCVMDILQVIVLRIKRRYSAVMVKIVKKSFSYLFCKSLFSIAPEV